VAVVVLTAGGGGVRGGRYARAGTHLTLGTVLLAITAASLHLGGASALIITVPTLLVLVACHVLGVRAAAFWTLASIVAMGVTVFSSELPAPPEHGVQPTLNVIFWTRLLVFVGVFSIAAAGRSFSDRQAAELEFLARHDPMTGLLNRREFDRRLVDALARSWRYEHRVAVLFVDLDEFKRINDDFGHSSGDIVLCEMAARIESVTRETDAAGRAGGDEFQILLEAVADEKSAELYAERLLQLLRQPIDLGCERVEVGASIGLVLFPDDEKEPGALTRAADLAMYRAKHAGGSAVQVYSNLQRQQAMS